MPPTARLLGLLCLALFLAAHGGCGGGGGPAGGPPLIVAPPVVDLGLVSGTAPTLVTHVVRNPLDVSATLTEPTPQAGLRVAVGTLPLQVGAGEEVSLPVVLTPLAAGPIEVSLDLRFSAGARSEQRLATFRAEVESVVVSAVPGVLAFDVVQAASSQSRVTRLTNTSTVSTVTLTTLVVPHPDVKLENPLPIVLGPGAQLDVTLRVDSAAGDTIDGRLELGPGDPGGPVEVGITANVGLREVVTDLGNQAFVGIDTALLQVQVPADAISLSLEARGASSATFGLGELVGPGGKVYENTSLTGDYIWSAGQGVFSAQVPNTDRTNLQLVAGGGTYSFRIRRLGGSATQVAVRAIVERRPGGTGSDGVLPLNVWLAQALPVDAAGAAADARLQAVLARLSAILGGQGVTLGAIDYYDVTDPAFDAVTSAEFPQLLALTATATAQRLNLFFVQQTLSGGVVGVAGTIGGPRINGTGVSGVMSVYEGFSTDTIALVAAHEIGHFLGLYHTVEQTGGHDFVDDTLECPANATGGGCNVVGGGYLMHWQAVGGTTITNGQGLVLRGHPLVEPPPAGTAKRRPGFALPQASLLEVQTLPPGWCGTQAPPVAQGAEGRGAGASR